MTLSAAQRAFLAEARRAVLATIDPAGRPRLVPICFVVGEHPDPSGRPLVYSPLDEKPKRAEDPLALARVHDIERRPDVTLLVDRWDEDWSRLAWLRCAGRAELIRHEAVTNPEHRTAVADLRAKYPQYVAQRIDRRPLIRIAIERVLAWGNLAPG